jgi:hypothetical protein
MADQSIVGTWKSLIYPKIHGQIVCKKISASTLECQFVYSADSSYRQGNSKPFVMNYIENETRLLASTDLAFDQNMSITLKLKDKIGYYSCVFPVDSGKIQIID